MSSLKESGSYWESTGSYRMADYYKRIVQRLEKQSVITETGCREWAGGPHNRLVYSYGVVTVKWPTVSSGRKTLYAHRAMYMASNNIAALPEGVEVSHRCHNSWCVNLAHLTAEARDVNTDRQSCRRTHSQNPQLEIKCPHVPSCIFVVKPSRFNDRIDCFGVSTRFQAIFSIFSMLFIEF